MRIRADEHVSPEIVRIVRELALCPGWEFTHVVDAGGQGTGDVTWITEFARDGGDAIVSADKDFLKRHHQVLAVCQTGLRVIHLPARWANSPCRLQAAHVLLWWDRIEETLKTCERRQCWRVPWSFSERSELVRIKVDYERARKKVKRAGRRAG